MYTMPYALVLTGLGKVDLDGISEAALRLKVHILRFSFVQATECSNGVAESGGGIEMVEKVGGREAIYRMRPPD